jgi:hypothetical protein
MRSLGDARFSSIGEALLELGFSVCALGRDFSVLEFSGPAFSFQTAGHDGPGYVPMEHQLHLIDILPEELSRAALGSVISARRHGACAFWQVFRGCRVWIGTIRNAPDGFFLGVIPECLLRMVFCQKGVS